MSFLEALLHRSVTHLTRLAGGLTLVALAIMVYSVLVPRALPVMLAMSVGHAVGIAGFGCFFLAVVIDATRSKSQTSVPPPADKARSASESSSSEGKP
jgi:hypothetical protein